MVTRFWFPLGIVVVLLATACGNGTSGLLWGKLDFGGSNQVTDPTPLFRSDGIKLYALGEGGVLLNGAKGISVVESHSQENLVWQIKDSDGTARPIYLRVQQSGAKWEAGDILAGPWGGGTGLFAAFPTRSGDVDLGVAPINDPSFNSSACKDAVIAEVTFVRRGKNTATSPRELTHDSGETESSHHVTYPFKKHTARTSDISCSILEVA